MQEYRDQETSLVQLKRSACKAGTYYAAPEHKVLFVMRLRGTKEDLLREARLRRDQASAAAAPSKAVLSIQRRTRGMLC